MASQGTSGARSNQQYDPNPPSQRANITDNSYAQPAPIRPQRTTVPPQNSYGTNPNVSFQEPERSWRSPPPASPNPDRSVRPTYDAVYSSDPISPPATGVQFDPEAQYSAAAGGGYSETLGQSGGDFRRKKSLVRPDREKIEPGHRQWHYRQHAAQLEEYAEEVGPDGYHQGAAIGPSATGNVPTTGLRRGKSLLGREEEAQEPKPNLFSRGGATLRRKKHPNSSGPTQSNQAGPGADVTSAKRGIFKNIAPGPVDAWMVYCWFITICIPPFLLRSCGMRTAERQRAWREKIGLMSIILTSMAGVGFLTFGFNQAVCGAPPNRYLAGTVDKASIIVNGNAYDFSRFQHPVVGNIFNGHQNPLYEGGWNVAGMDLSFYFQYHHSSCRNVITAAPNSVITQTGGLLDWIFPCNQFNQFGTSQANLTGYDNTTQCHLGPGTSTQVQKTLARPSGQVYYSWDNVTTDGRNLAVYESAVLNLDLLKWLDTSLVQYPPFFDELKKANGTFNKRDLTMYIYRNGYKELAECLKDTIAVGFIDTKTIGCVASQVVLYVSLIFIIGVVGIRFAMAVIFGWFVSYKIGAFSRESYTQRMQRATEIENWTENIYQPAPSRYRPSVATPAAGKGGAGKKESFLPTTSRFSRADMRPVTLGGIPEAPYRRGQQTMSTYGGTGLTPGNKGGMLTPSDPMNFRSSRSSTSLPSFSDRGSGPAAGSVCPFPLHNVVPQPPADYEPFNFPLLQAICLVTAYSESLEGLRTTLDSLATTDYPNSHKVLMVVADGMVKGAGNALTTPEIVLSMMKELVVPLDEVEAHSYVSIADGHKRHNMAKVYAGFYDYDDNTVEPSKQQRVPIVLVAKCGNPLEAKDPKPGNRGKRDSQMVLMAFLQKVMFDERMTTFEYEFFNSIWRCTGVSPDRYEVVLCVDADTKVFPDSLTRMAACMVHDEEIMGVCGETKIANKSETWVTMIQVFEYYISHHLTKAFESMFGGVTCLPGCFSMYRIKVPKGSSGFWVPILANPDIVEHYSENIVDTLHKKNLLLLGEDRYLTTLMLKTFPKRKMIFCPQAVCKTVVPDTFSILLSQRRRWINSTVHNLAELLLVRDLCGTFCFSMQFVVGMELIGTLVLPAAIAFTVYLIISTIIPGGPSTTISLILLAIVLGLPGLLIVITSRKIAYVGWMLVYLASLPIWNFVLPAYAYWHFDDFSWGQTRKALGDDKEHLGDKEGEFDSSHIIMKRWAEFERERRWKSGMQSRDSTYDVIQRNGSPKRMEKRYSMGSHSTETYADNMSGSRYSAAQPMIPSLPTHDELRRPVGSYQTGGASLFRGDSSPSHSSVSQDDGMSGSPAIYEDTEPIVPAYNARQSTNTGYFNSPQTYQQYQHTTSYARARDERDPPPAPPPVRGLPRPSPNTATARRQSAQPAPAAPSPAAAPALVAQPPPPQPARGVTLTDPGVVPSLNDSVRRVARNSKRSSTTPVVPQGTSNSGANASSQPPLPQSAVSPTSTSASGHGRRSTRSSTTGPSNLPPGAAPPQFGRYE